MLWYDGHVSTELPLIGQSLTDYGNYPTPDAYMAIAKKMNIGFLTPYNSSASDCPTGDPGFMTDKYSDYYFWLDKSGQK